VVEREDAPPPVATTLFKLTDRGRKLRPAIDALGQWGAPLLGEEFGADEFRSHWLALPIEIGLAGHLPKDARGTIGVRNGDEATLVEIADGQVRARAWTDETPDVVLSGSPRSVLGTLIGRLSLDDARARGVHCEGDVAVLERLLATERV
jgi:hypothetical protein